MPPTTPRRQDLRRSAAGPLRYDGARRARCATTGPRAAGSSDGRAASRARPCASPARTRRRSSAWPASSSGRSARRAGASSAGARSRASAEGAPTASRRPAPRPPGRAPVTPDELRRGLFDTREREQRPARRQREAPDPDREERVERYRASSRRAGGCSPSRPRRGRSRGSSSRGSTRAGGPSRVGAVTNRGGELA